MSRSIARGRIVSRAGRSRDQQFRLHGGQPCRKPSGRSANAKRVKDPKDDQARADDRWEQGGAALCHAPLWACSLATPTTHSRVTSGARVGDAGWMQNRSLSSFRSIPYDRIYFFLVGRFRFVLVFGMIRIAGGGRRAACQKEQRVLAGHRKEHKQRHTEQPDHPYAARQAPAERASEPCNSRWK